ncbi:MAG: DEAD/DEAH box helicase [Actinomycetota bacterium]|nr:DEAD/DEAH box helicase [Actinomycetota bacterium]
MSRNPGRSTSPSAGDPLPPDSPDAGGSTDPLVADVMSAPGPPPVTKDRREHGGTRPELLDDDALAQRTKDERVDLGLADYDPADVPPATDDVVEVDITDTLEYQEELAEVRRQLAKGELIVDDGSPRGFPPTRYE